MNKMNTRQITLTVHEIFDLAKAAQLIPHKATLADSQLSDEDAETEYTIFTCDDRVTIKDDDGTPRLYGHGAYLSDYPEEGTFPLGNELKGETK